MNFLLSQRTAKFTSFVFRNVEFQSLSSKDARHPFTSNYISLNLRKQPHNYAIFYVTLITTFCIHKTWINFFCYFCLETYFPRCCSWSIDSMGVRPKGVCNRRTPKGRGILEFKSSNKASIFRYRDFEIGTRTPWKLFSNHIQETFRGEQCIPRGKTQKVQNYKFIEFLASVIACVRSLP